MTDQPDQIYTGALTLPELVQKSGLSKVVALTIFNRGMGLSKSLTCDEWLAFFQPPGSEKFKPVPPELLERAVSIFSKPSSN